MFWIALTAQLAAPVPERLGTWFKADDVPEYLIRRDQGLWQVPIRINVTFDGTLRNCEVEATSGIADLDKLTCQIIMRRAKLRPARSIEGLPSFGVYRTSILWVVADAPWDASKVSNPDIEVTVERLPRGLESPTLVGVMFAVDAEGRKSSCSADEGKGLPRVGNHPVLVPIACEQIMKMYRATPAKDATGLPILSVQNGLVRFSAPRSN